MIGIFSSGRFFLGTLAWHSVRNYLSILYIISVLLCRHDIRTSVDALQAACMSLHHPLPATRLASTTTIDGSKNELRVV